VVATYLAANNGSFDLQDPPPDLAIPAARAVEIVAARTRGPIRKAEVLFGVLHMNLGTIPPPRVWLVLLVGPGFAPLTDMTAPPPPAAAASAARAANLFFAWAFVDAQTGNVVVSFGSGPPP
jgi:hypothetical protein